ncbi:MAG TPA: Fe-S protein assembly co-chaperone HscB [Candidatus Sulfotelmatobacter sp.]|nr:Fe-S protein assembly co-chaperone HscB [Candidatus Sulfotelmatobacter sp.]
MADAAATTGTLHDLAPCWSCKGPVSARAPFCHACGAIQPPRALDHFSRLNLPVRFDLDPADIEKQYFGLQRYFHPDRFAAKSAKERALSLQHATNLNRAYETLKQPLGRAEYLLELQGRKIDGEATIADAGLLMEAMEWREELAQAGDRAAVDAIIDRAGQVFDAKVAAIGEAFARDDLAGAAKLATALRYFSKLIDEARARRARLEA